MSKSLSEEEKQKWIDIIENQKQSGLSIARWCKQNQIRDYRFYYWQAKLSPQNFSRADFLELKDKNGSGITIVFDNMRIQLEKGIDSFSLKTCFDLIRKYLC